MGIATDRAHGHLADRLLTVEAALQRAGKGKRIVIAGTGAAAIDAGLVRLVRHAFAARDLLLADGYDSINAITARLGKSKGLLTSLARLSWLSPRIVGALLAGRQPAGLTPKKLLGLSKDLPHDWSAQRPFLGFID